MSRGGTSEAGYFKIYYTKRIKWICFPAPGGPVTDDNANDTRVEHKTSL